MRPSSYRIQGDRVFEEIKDAPEDVRQSFYELIEALSKDPLPGTSEASGILPLQGRFPGGWTAPFHRGILAYKVTIDIPTVTLMDAWWL